MEINATLIRGSIIEWDESRSDLKFPGWQIETGLGRITILLMVQI